MIIKGRQVSSPLPAPAPHDGVTDDVDHSFVGQHQQLTLLYDHLMPQVDIRRDPGQEVQETNKTLAIPTFLCPVVLRPPPPEPPVCRNTSPLRQGECTWSRIKPLPPSYSQHPNAPVILAQAVPLTLLLPVLLLVSPCPPSPHELVVDLRSSFDRVE